MQIAMIGLGRMGANMARRLLADGHEVVAYNRDFKAVEKLMEYGAKPAKTLAEVAQQLTAPRCCWVMLPSGAVTEGVIEELSQHLSEGDAIIDGGNSYYKDDVRRANALQKKGIYYLDVGTSGGVWGLERGYCLMIGGDKKIVSHLTPIFRSLAPGNCDLPASEGRDENHNRSAEEGFLHCGNAGSGHYVKMIHNGIEYGMMQAYAEGFDILSHADNKNLPEAEQFDLNLADIAELWRRGSVVTSWLLDLSAIALAKSAKLDEYSGHVNDSGEGRWTVQAAIDTDTPAEVLTAALFARFRSRQEHTFAEKVLSAMREGFGGHTEPKK